MKITSMERERQNLFWCSWQQGLHLLPRLGHPASISLVCGQLGSEHGTPALELWVDLLCCLHKGGPQVFVTKHTEDILSI